MIKRTLVFILSLSVFFLIDAEKSQAQTLVETLKEKAIAFDSPGDFDRMLDQIEDQKLVLMGEASHGTSEFYVWRAELSKRLIAEKGYNFIAVEGDWPALSRINKYVKHKPDAPESAEVAMDYIDRWPLWMWRNQEVKDLVVWLHDYNRDLSPEERVGLYGIDLYAKQAAMNDVVRFFEETDPESASRAERAYGCLSRFSDIGEYLQMVARTGDDCSTEMEEVLAMVRNSAAFDDSWQSFNAEHNAKLVINAEEHYRGNLRRDASSWNARASHFYLTAKRLLDFYGDNSKGIVWAHNTHIGDARATDMARQGAHNIGQLAREDLGIESVYAIGFGTYTGQVLAALQWEGRMETMNIPDARSGSWEAALESTGFEQFYLLLHDENLRNVLQSPIPHRAIGVTYNPEQEAGNYVNTDVPKRYDAFIFFRETGVLKAFD